MPTYAVLDCNNRSEKDGIRGITFRNLPVKKTPLAKQWLDQLRRDESFGFPKPENVYVCNKQTSDLSKRSKYFMYCDARKPCILDRQAVN